MHISAPANNNASTGTVSAAAGLQHAFFNAANLANVSTGQANTQVVNAGPGGSASSVPQAEDRDHRGHPVFVRELQPLDMSTSSKSSTTPRSAPTLQGSSATLRATNAADIISGTLAATIDGTTVISTTLSPGPLSAVSTAFNAITPASGSWATTTTPASGIKGVYTLSFAPPGSITIGSGNISGTLNIKQGSTTYSIPFTAPATLASLSSAINSRFLPPELRAAHPHLLKHVSVHGGDGNKASSFPSSS